MADSLDVSERVGRQAKTKERKECLQKKKRWGENKREIKQKDTKKDWKKEGKEMQENLNQ